MTPDLVERLRHENKLTHGYYPVMDEAADEIERLQEWNRLRALDIVTLGQEINRLRHTLKIISEYPHKGNGSLELIQAVARNEIEQYEEKPQAS